MILRPNVPAANAAAAKKDLAGYYAHIAALDDALGDLLGTLKETGRGLRTKRWTYTEDSRGPWLMFDNDEDPYQLKNLAGDPARARLRGELAETLRKKREDLNDDFRPAGDILSRWRYLGRNEV